MWSISPVKLMHLFKQRLPCLQQTSSYEKPTVSTTRIGWLNRQLKIIVYLWSSTKLPRKLLLLSKTFLANPVNKCWEQISIMPSILQDAWLIGWTNAKCLADRLLVEPLWIWGLSSHAAVQPLWKGSEHNLPSPTIAWKSAWPKWALLSSSTWLKKFLSRRIETYPLQSLPWGYTADGTLFNTIEHVRTRRYFMTAKPGQALSNLT